MSRPVVLVGISGAWLLGWAVGSALNAVAWGL